jgi:hypothetical protein
MYVYKDCRYPDKKWMLILVHTTSSQLMFFIGYTPSSNMAGQSPKIGTGMKRVSRRGEVAGIPQKGALFPSMRSQEHSIWIYKIWVLPRKHAADSSNIWKFSMFMSM